MQNNGLKVIHGDEELIAIPTLATDNVAEIGIADYIIICTKSFSLEDVVKQLKPCINADTIILPLLNGVDSTSKIKALLPGVQMAEGCVYIVSRLVKPGGVDKRAH